jgi:hypothetical protein
LQIVAQVNYMAVDMLRAQADNANTPASAVPNLGMVSSAAQGSAIAALEQSALQEARQRADAGNIAAVGGKRKLARTSDDGASEGEDDSDGPVSKAARDTDEIDI